MTPAIYENSYTARKKHFAGTRGRSSPLSWPRASEWPGPPRIPLKPGAQVVDVTRVTDLAQDRDDIQALMAPTRTPNVYAALEQLNDEPTPEPAPLAPMAPTATAATTEMPVAAERVDRAMEWSALGTDPAADETGPSWADMGAEPVGPEVLRWRREDDDIVPSGTSGGGRGRMRLQLLRRSAA
jgi:hypothetical protein